jgi:hypothetical protein
MAQAVEHMPSKCKALSAYSSTAKIKMKWNKKPINVKNWKQCIAHIAHSKHYKI